VYPESQKSARRFSLRRGAMSAFYNMGPFDEVSRSKDFYIDGAKISQRSKPPESAELCIDAVRRARRKKYSNEEKIRVALSRISGENSFAE
jgi:hypothetical protein